MLATSFMIYTIVMCDLYNCNQIHTDGHNGITDLDYVCDYEEWKWKMEELLCTVVHVDPRPEQVFEDMKLSTTVVDLGARRRESNDYISIIFSAHCVFVTEKEYDKLINVVLHICAKNEETIEKGCISVFVILILISK